MKTAVIGIGNMGKNHARVYAELPQSQLVGIADLNIELGGKLSKKLNASFYPDYEELLDKEKPDVVSICTPTGTHYQIAISCIKKGIHILIEKPITKNLAQAEEIKKLAKNKKVKILVGHIERYNPAVSKVKELIKKGLLGKITSIMARRVGGFPPQIKDVDIAVDLAIHDIDIINYLLEESPKKVYLNKRSHHIEKRADSVEYFLKYSQASAYIQANWITPVKIRKLNITGTEGYLEMDYVTQNIDFYKSNYSKLKENTGEFSDYILVFSQSEKTEIPVEKKEPLKEEIAYFLSCVENDINSEIDYAIDALKIALRKN